MAPTKNEKQRFRLIANSFEQNLRALRVFSDQIGNFATEHDRLALGAFISAVRELSDNKAVIETLDQVQARLTVVSDSETEETPEEINVNLSAEKGPALWRALKSFLHAAPVQGGLLRSSALVSLMSYLEGLIADLIHAFYERHPAAMPAKERTISLAELREIGSIDEAEQYLIVKEANAVLRETLENQIQYFSKRPKVDIAPLNKYKAFLIEIDQRRNILVHNRGIVNRTYLERVDPALLDTYSAQKEKRLGVSEEYISGAIDLVEVCGIILLQQCWRKWYKREVESADSALIDVTFDGLKEERYEMVKQVAEFAEGIPLGRELSKRIICINRAIALRDSGETERIEDVLSRHDWSACALNFQVALASVRANEEEFFELIPRAVAAEELGREELETWPLFRNFRGTDRFAQMLNALLPEDK